MTGEGRPLRVVVADDEPTALTLLSRSVEADDRLELVARCANGAQAVAAIRRESPDLVFLDIRMPELDGFEVVDALEPTERPRVVFVTAHDEHALEAFERYALAYLLKPYDPEEFEAVVDHLVPLLRRVGADGGTGTVSGGATAGHQADHEAMRALVEEMLEAREGPRQVVVRTGKRTRLVPVHSIDWLEADGNYVRLHCGEETHLLSEALTGLLERLSGAGFARIHRSAAVNLARVREFRTDDHRDFTVILESGKKLRLSRTYRAEVEARLGDRI